MTDLRSDREIRRLAAFCRARIAETRAEADDATTYSLAARVLATRCDALDGLVDAMEMSANDGAPPVDDVGIAALCDVACVWRIRPDGSVHPDFDDRWAAEL